MECSTRLERWEGQAGAREYWFSAREVGHALTLVAGGASYRHAASTARSAAGRSHERLTGRRWRRRDPNLDGQLVANWVDSLAAVVTAGELPGRWPERLALDSREFRIDHGPRAGQSFHVFAAVGHDEPGRPRVWRLGAFPRRTEADWQEFLSLCEGTPTLVVTDFDHALRKALASVFPRPGERPPELRLCELHVRRRLENALAPLDGQSDDAVMRAFRHALFHHDNWIRFSIGAVEATLRQVDRAFHGRSQSFTNGHRLNLLLDLMTLHQNGDADARRWADRLRECLHNRGGTAPQQRPHDDQRGQPSLLA